MAVISPKKSTNSSEQESVTANTPQELLEKIQHFVKEKDEIYLGIKQIQKESRLKKLAESLSIAKELPTICEIFTQVPADAKASKTFLKVGESVQKKNEQVITESISKDLKERTKVVKVSLTQDELLSLRGQYPDLKNIPHTRFDSHIFNNSKSETHEAQVYRKWPMLAGYVGKDFDFSIRDVAYPNSEVALVPDDEQSEERNIAQTKSTIYKKLNELLSDLAGPEFAPVLETKHRASEIDVQNRVNAFQFSGGPADQPAFYDFYSLQIAFEHIWQEVFDQSIENLVHQAYEQIVGYGIDPPELLENETSHDLLKKLRYYANVLDTEEAVPIDVIKTFKITAQEWYELDEFQKSDLELNVARVIAQQQGVVGLEKNVLRLIASGNKIIDFAREMHKQRGVVIVPTRPGSKVIIPTRKGRTLGSILDQIEHRLKEKYAFTIFAANEKERSVNFGVVLNYRQKWTPLAYQAGELIKTIPLAPKEVRKFSKKIITKQSKSGKDTSFNSAKFSSESSDTVRSEAEIIDKAQKKISSNVSAKTGYSNGISPWSFNVEASHGKDSSTDSSQTKKDFREAVVKSAQEVKNERSVEINTSDSVDFESDESGEISNPNDEIAVTYLFYELQRRYRLNEYLNHITPCVMVAQEVPSPEEIDEDWLIGYQWIISQVILDQSFQPALYYLTSKVVGDEYAVDQLHKNLTQQREMVKELKEEFLAIKTQLFREYKQVQGSIEDRIAAAENKHHGHWIEFQQIATGKVQYLDIAKMREEAAREEYDKAIKDEQDMRARLEREVTALQAATDNYTKAVSDHLNRKTEVRRLQLHVKENILYYMQAIWTFEPADQRYFRLFKTKVPILNGKKTYSFIDSSGSPSYPNWNVATNTFQVSCELETPITYKTLVEVADVDHLLGFKGNYMIFPLLESNALTDFMMAPYINKYSGISDPDPSGNWTLEDFNKYVSLLRDQLERNEISHEQFDSYKPGLAELYKQLITDPLRENEEIVIPTKSLFIEALPGAHPILEDFKLMHRAIDVKKVQAEVRYAEMENLRGAARLAEDQLDDPSIEKKIVVESNGGYQH